MAHFFLSKSLSRRIDRSPALREVRWRAETWLVSVFWWICGRLSPDTASGLGRRMLRLVGPRLRKSSHFDRNLSIAFPDLSDRQRRDLLSEVWGNTGAVLAEYPHLGEIVGTAFDEHFKVVDKADLGPIRAGQRQAIFVSAHIGNWETSAGAAAHLGIPLTVVYTPIKNPYIDRILRRMREGLRCELLNRDTSLPQLMKALEAGRSLGLVVDHRDDGGVPVPFFGHPKLSTIIPARLALRFKCDLIPARAERLDGTRFRFTLNPPIVPDPNLGTAKAQAEQMTAELNAVFEQWIRERPEQWLCAKRAWAKDLTPKGADRKDRPRDASAPAGPPRQSKA